MRRRLLKLCLLLCSTVLALKSYSQFSVNSSKTPEQLVREILGDGVEDVTNVTYNGVSVGTPQFGTGIFEEPGARLDGVKKGIVLSTLSTIHLAKHPIQSQSVRSGETGNNFNHKYYDADLGKIMPDPSGSNNNLYETSVIEFDFIPKGDSMAFNYVFASDEYPVYVCSKFNDIFGFFLSGPGINGPYTNGAINIAKLPNKDVPVAINTVNNGEEGSYHGADSNLFCNGGEGLKNKDFFVNNLDDLVVNDLLFNGFTKKLTAKAKVHCGKKYHIKLAIADINDMHWNSGVFIETGSFKVVGVTEAKASVVVDKAECRPTTLLIENESNAISHLWNFGDGTISTDKIPTHSYNNEGTYNISYVALDSTKCVKSDTQTFQAVVDPEKLFQSNLEFTAPDKCNTLNSYLAKFKLNQNGVDSSHWDLGDGTTTTNVNSLNHTYTQEGTYQVKIKVFDNYCGKDSILTRTINYQKPTMLEADIDVDTDTVGCEANFEFHFINNTGNGANYAHYWDFGDGNTSTLYEPVHSYSQPGTYTVMYVVRNTDYCNLVDTAYLTLNVLNSTGLSASLSISPIPECNLVDSINVQFTLSQTSYDVFEWNFGDGTIVNGGLNPSHWYKGYGTYNGNVKLTDIPCGKDTVINFTIDFKAPSKIVANAGVVEDTVGCEGNLDLTFFNNSYNSATTKHFWDFGDGNTSTDYIPTHHYNAPGVYNIKYVIENDSFCIPKDSLIFEVTILNVNAFSAKLTAPQLPLCNLIDSVSVDLKVEGEAFDNVVWNFGDGSPLVYNLNEVTHVYNGYGEYNGSVTVTDTACSKDSVINFTIKFGEPSQVKAIAGVLQDTVGCGTYSHKFYNNTDLTGGTTHFWDFGDGDTSTLYVPDHHYANPGTYEVTYIARNDDFCIPYDTVKFMVTVLNTDPLDANLILPQLPNCNLVDSISLDFEVNGVSFDEVEWDFGDGTPKVYNLLMVSHTYSGYGVYNGQVKVTDTACLVDSIIPFSINFEAPSQLEAIAGANNDTIGCGIYDLSFFNNTDKNGLSNHWDFGDGNTSTEYEPTHHYDSTGTYTVVYVGTNPNYCIPEDTVVFQVTVLNTDPMTASLDEPEVPKCSFEDSLSLPFTLSGKSFDNVVWDFGDGSVNVYDKLSVIHTYGHGRYVGTVTIRDTACNTDSVISFTVNFEEPTRTIANAGALDSMVRCEPFIAEFYNNSNGTEHFWDFGDGNTSNLPNPKHKYLKIGKYTVTYIATNPALCIKKDTVSFEVNVLKVNGLKASLEVLGAEPCVNMNFELNITAILKSTSVDSLIWDFGDGSPIIYQGSNDTIDTLKHVYDKEGVYIIKVKAFDTFCGRDTTIEVSVTHKRLPDFTKVTAPNIFTPNGDRVNDEFKMFISGEKEHDFYNDLLEYEITVFNRWGREIYTTGNINLSSGEAPVHWDGTGKASNELSDGIYFFTAKYKLKCLDDSRVKPRVHKGHVTIRR